MVSNAPSQADPEVGFLSVWRAVGLKAYEHIECPDGSGLVGMRKNGLARRRCTGTWGLGPGVKQLFNFTIRWSLSFDISKQK